MIKRGSKQRAGRANLRIREKTNGFLGLKQGAGRANLRKKQGAWRANLRKKRGNK